MEALRAARMPDDENGRQLWRPCGGFMEDYMDHTLGAMGGKNIRVIAISIMVIISSMVSASLRRLTVCFSC